MPNFSYGYGAEMVDVTVNIETGNIRVDRVVCTGDVGKRINPTLAHDQSGGQWFRRTRLLL